METNDFIAVSAIAFILNCIITFLIIRNAVRPWLDELVRLQRINNRLLKLQMTNQGISQNDIDTVTIIE
jgi:uncharacterized membrane protein YdjX (TVP38/TMEM64 family)